MSGMPNAELASEQQQPGDPSGSSESLSAGYPTSQYDNGLGMMGSEMPEAPRDKFFRKMKEQPLVPIGESSNLLNSPVRIFGLILISSLPNPLLRRTSGSLLTVGALIAASNHLRTGNRDQFNKALRWRVGFQGLTVLAALAGSFYYGQKAAASVPAPPSTPADAPLQHGTVTTLPGRAPTHWQQSRAEERATKDRSGFEGRVGQALDRELNDDKRLEEALLGKEEELDLDQLKKSSKSRPVIGQDSRRQV